MGKLVMIELHPGTEIFLSELGHNNFHYPKLNSSVIIEEILVVDKLNHWIGPDLLVACVIKNQELPKSLVDNTDIDNKIIWIRRD